MKKISCDICGKDCTTDSNRTKILFDYINYNLCNGCKKKLEKAKEDVLKNFFRGK
jgi:Pyruvate/2-oxoacid:ferredoxin oxidoreductase delta subunit